MTSGRWASEAVQPDRVMPAPARAGGRMSPDPRHADPVTVIDCDRCQVRGAGCGDCVVTFLLGGPPPDARLSVEERQALDVLSEAGLVPPLRMVEVLDAHSWPTDA
jgi:hypothetical protein